MHRVKKRPSNKRGWYCTLVLLGMMVSKVVFAREGIVHAALDAPTPETSSIVLTVEVRGLEEEGETYKSVKERVEGQGQVFLEQEVQKIGKEAKQDLLGIRIVITSQDKEGYSFTSRIKTSNKTKEAIEHQVYCNYCTENELVEKTLEGLRETVEIMKKAEEKKAKASTPVTNGTKPNNGNHQQANGKQPPTNGHKDTPEPKPLKGQRPLQVGGWVTTGVGAATLGAGIGLWVKGKTSEVNLEDVGRLKTHDYATPGTVMVGIGAALVISGVAMVAVDCVQAKRAREEAKKKRVQVFPAVSRTSFGIGFTSRF